VISDIYNLSPLSEVIRSALIWLAQTTASNGMGFKTTSRGTHHLIALPADFDTAILFLSHLTDSRSGFHLYPSVAASAGGIFICCGAHASAAY
jgi:hypothetical protein